MTTITPLDQARILAKKAHSSQTRRDGVTPYFTHLEAVVSRLITDEEKTVGYLHDILEDTTITIDDLREEHGFSLEIVATVLRLTKPKHIDYFRYVTELRNDSLARRVKIADILSNLSDNPTKHQMIKYAAALLILVP